MQDCNAGEFGSAGLVCTGCSTECLTCQNTADECLTCDTGSTFPYFYANPLGSCLATCPDLLYGNAAFLCVDCVSPCERCTAADVCQSCRTGFFFHEGDCVASCPVGITI